MDTRQTVSRLLGQVEGHASEVRSLSREYFPRRMSGGADEVLDRVRGYNSRAIDTLEKLRPFEEGMDAGERARLSEACVRVRAASLYGLCLAGVYDRAGETIEEISRRVHPEARDGFTVRAGAFLVLLATLRRDAAAAETAFAAIRPEGLGWELATERAMAAFNVFFCHVAAGRPDEALPYYRVMAMLAASLRESLAREGGPTADYPPAAPPGLGPGREVRFLGREFPFELASRVRPDPLRRGADRRRECLDLLLQILADGVRALADSVMATDRGPMVRPLFAGLAGLCSTERDFARLAGLSRELVLMCSKTEDRLSDGAFYLAHLAGHAFDPPAAEAAAEAGHELACSLASCGRIREALEICRRMAGIPHPSVSDDWKARAAAAVFTACLERPGAAGKVAELEDVYESLRRLRDSRTVRLCRLFAEANLLPFYFARGDAGRISLVYGRISGSPDRSQAALEMKLAACTNLVSYHAAAGRLSEARRHFEAIDTESHREPPFLQNWARAATALCAGFFHGGAETEAWMLASELGLYGRHPEVEECLEILSALMGGMPPRTCH